ncbi:MAG: hypothetical protein M0Z78_06540 [Betaproteobacteria bacterium]|nr:hypothetical protein [Betaproteobacteria bacterium]
MTYSRTHAVPPFGSDVPIIPELSPFSQVTFQNSNLSAEYRVYAELVLSLGLGSAAVLLGKTCCIQVRKPQWVSIRALTSFCLEV